MACLVLSTDRKARVIFWNDENQTCDKDVWLLLCARSQELHCIRVVHFSQDLNF